MKKNQQHGFSALEVIIVLAVVGVLGFVGWKVMSARTSTGKAPSTASQTPPAANPSPSQKQPPTSNEPQQLIWQQTATGWQSTQTPLACPEQPIMKAPADISKVTSILYPGQTRGGNYKPHGGFRFDATANDQVKVSAPIDAYLVRGARYLAEGEVQYTFDAMNNCGVMYRVGHLRVLPDNLQKIAETWPQPVEGDSRTNQIMPALFVKQGETLATTVGIIKDKNTFFDWGVYDYRQANEASKDPAYQAAHPQEQELAWHAVCWFDWLPSKDASTVKGLPAGDPTSGKKSDYCK